MPYTRVEPELYFELWNVPVYHVYISDSLEAGVEEYLYTTDILEAHENQFDIRNLRAYRDGEDHRKILGRAIESEELTFWRLRSTREARAIARRHGCRL